MLQKLQAVRIRFGTSSLSESKTVKNLGLIMDRSLTFDAHIDALVQKCTGILIAISHAKHCIPTAVIKDIVNALVMSSVRYCISIYGTHGQTQTHRIQKLINFCARVVSGKRKHDHISAELKRLHWLSASQLTLFHRLCLIKKVLSSGVPPGLAEQFSFVSHSHNTRQHGQLQRPRARTNAGIRRLCFSGSDAFNRLPDELRQLSFVRFKTQLKGAMFNDST